MIKQKIMSAVLGLLLLPLPLRAASKPFRIGVMLPGDEWASSVNGLKEGMKGLGSAEGRDVVYLFENAEGDKKKVDEVTKKFVAEKVDVIFTITNTALKVVAQATKGWWVQPLRGS